MQNSASFLNSRTCFCQSVSEFSLSKMPVLLSNGTFLDFFYLCGLQTSTFLGWNGWALSVLCSLRFLRTIIRYRAFARVLHKPTSSGLTSIYTIQKGIPYSAAKILRKKVHNTSFILFPSTSISTKCN